MENLLFGDQGMEMNGSHRYFLVFYFYFKNIFILFLI